MKTIKEILDNYKDYRTDFEDRFGRRLCAFLTVDQIESIGFGFSSEGDMANHIPKEWTEQSVIEQLEDDLQFGYEKCCNKRGISSFLMASVVLSWCKVLENGLDGLDYFDYGKNIFETVAKRYNIKL